MSSSPSKAKECESPTGIINSLSERAPKIMEPSDGNDGPNKNTAPMVNKSSSKYSISAGMHFHVVNTDRCGALSVHVQGDLEEVHRDPEGKCVFLIVHDVGSNHKTFKKLFDQDAFEEIRKRSVFIYVDVPGQEPGAEDLPDDFNYPTIQAIGEDLATVLDQLRIKYCLGLGIGAGSNIILRFALMYSARCLGLILIHPTANSQTMIRSFKDKITKRKMSNVNPSGEAMLLFRKFGHKIEGNIEKSKAMEEYQESLERLQLNKKNVRKYMEAFQARTDVIHSLAKNLKCDTLLVVGGKSSHIMAAEAMYTHMDKVHCSILKVEGVANILEEAPMKMFNAILLFCQGIGWLTSVVLHGVDRKPSLGIEENSRNRTSFSMEDYDKPNLRKLSVSSKE